MFLPLNSCALTALFLLPAGLMAQPAPAPAEILSRSRQMVVVTAKGWSATEGLLRRWERRDRAWQQVGPFLPVVLGRGGLGWGRGLHPPSSSGPQKKEGDGKSPAGVFRLPYAFGYAPADAVRPIKLPYVRCTASLECVDDTNSSYYNIVVDRALVEKPDWKSSEKMRMSDGEYELGIFVAQNSTDRAPGAGSCVFMHIWKGPHHPTSGCTAMSRGAMEGLVGWLDPAADPVLVQLPQREYRQRQRAWALPAIEF